MRPGLSACIATLAFALGSGPVFAQDVGATCDMSGEWSARSREDWDDRQLTGANLGDYTGIPLNDAGRRMARTWSASLLSLPTQQVMPHPAQYFMRGPFPNFRMSKVVDAVTQETVGYAVIGPLMIADRMIWTNGRSEPPDYVEHTWTGFSTATCERGMLAVTTTRMKHGYLRRNGVPASSQSRMTEYFIRHGTHLTIVQFIEDPLYLEEPFIRTTDFDLNPSQNARRTEAREVGDEIATWPRGYVPSYPVDERHAEFAEKTGIPYEATGGGKETLYPEYLQKLNKMIRSSAEAPAVR